MALNPVVYTEKVVRSFLRYQLTAYQFADPRLHDQMRELLSLDATRQSPLLKGPYVSLSRSFQQGAAVDELIEEGVFHPLMRQRIPGEITHVYGHQERAIRSIHAGKTTLISTGTGSGKTECFLYPIVSHCLNLRDQGVPPGISAVIVYPMNALAEDQLGRLRGLLAGTGVTFGMYVGKTPEAEADVTGIRLPTGSSRADYEARLTQVRAEQRSDTVHPPEEVCSRQVMRTPGSQPRILLTNVKQLELLLTRQQDVDLFVGAELDTLVFDEAHTFTGAQGAETACLIRRLRSFCGKDAQETVCIATSATIVDQGNPDAALDFASRFFGVPRDDVVTIGESYAPDVWQEPRGLPAAPTHEPAAVLNACVTAVDDEADPDNAVHAAYRILASEELPAGDYPAALHEALSGNELVFQLSELLSSPRPLVELIAELKEKVGREVSEPEILAWLTLGAAARDESRPLLRPVMHGFVRGISGGVVSFPFGKAGAGPEPRLWLAAEDEIASREEEAEHAHFPLTTCTTCGQHYFISFLQDFEFTKTIPGGGVIRGSDAYWEPMEEALGGHRVVLTDEIVGNSDDEDLEDHSRTSPLFFCRHCGAAHPTGLDRCLHCGVAGELVRLFAIRQNKDNPGVLTSCICCGANGRRMGSRYREPARPVRATNVADVHVLSQDMVQHAERPRLLVFCDNRQDAAFQAGWMKDHARRFRLRALMAEGVASGLVSIGDLTHHLDEVLNRDESLSRALVPEVWQVVRREGSGGRHEQERRKFLRMQVLREVTLSSRQPLGLEPWGRMKVDYDGLHPSLPWIQQNALGLGLPAEELTEGVAGVLDYLRRRHALFDPDFRIFSRFWMDGDLEIQQGYLPQLGSPVGTKLRREATDKKYIIQWVSSGGDTTLRQIARKWGVESDQQETFLESLFQFLAEEQLLVPVTLTGARGNAVPGTAGSYQVSADRLRMRSNHGFYRCRSCRRLSARQTPKLKCLAWRCDGDLEFRREDPDNYNLQLLDEAYSMLRPEEHTAMVPHDERERLENLFKGASDAVNCFVCTPTLEMGVDIGALDAILMRNVPPLPANYWQRAGRAGRRHRMAVDITYCRPVSHDRAYFAEPLKLLGGRVDPPAFNMRNELMVAKHVHATLLTRLHQYIRDEARNEGERERIDHILKTCLPAQISRYLFDDENNVRSEMFDFSSLAELIRMNREDLTSYVSQAFHQGWPTQDAEVTTMDALSRHVDDCVTGLVQLVDRLRRRLRWAMAQLTRLNALRLRQGSLEPADDALFNRCDRLVKRLKGIDRRRRREAEGYDDVNTFGVLAAEGFLPGYGLEVGSVLGSAEVPFWRTGALEFVLPRPPSVALREYVPGNLIYANGNRFVARLFHRDVDEQRIEMPHYEVSVENQAVQQTAVGRDAAGFGAVVLPAISVCDVDLVHQSHISDEEDLRFQLGVAVYGLEREQHSGGVAWQWGEQAVHHRKGVHLRLVNVGASSAIARSDFFGYPVCTVCGQSTSPLSSQAQHDNFIQSHMERCGRRPDPVGFYADVVADALSLPSCDSPDTAYSVLESMRMAASHVLDMHVDDLQILVIGHVGADDVSALLWDPMPGGSGLLDQLLAHWDQVVLAAKEIAEHCPSACDTSCIDCLQSFRNGFYHKNLDRQRALDVLNTWGSSIVREHDIPPRQPAQEDRDGALPVNVAERRLQHLLRAAGFAEGTRGEQLRLDVALGTTTPDVIYRADHHDDDEGVCIYLDGLSQHIHGNAETAGRDKEIRDWLRGNGYDVIEITAHDLGDGSQMAQHFRRLAGYLRADDLRVQIRNDQSWFDDESEVSSTVVGFEPKPVSPTHEQKYVSCVPLVPLKAAASQFGDPQAPNVDEWEWVEVTGSRLRAGMFVAQVVGKSMEPRIPDGAWCLFDSNTAGSRQGKIVLVELQDDKDPETGERYTVKRYRSEKTDQGGDDWRHVRITLEPLNTDFDPFELSVEDENALRVVAEFVRSL